jgi:hypothetical protein
MAPTREFYLDYEAETIAKICCARCRESIGRVETVPVAEFGEAAEKRRQEVEGEIAVILAEHRPMCPGHSDS